MIYKGQYYDLGGFPKKPGKNRTKSNARRMVAINKTGNRLWRREFDNPAERAAQPGDPLFYRRLLDNRTGALLEVG